MTSLDILFCVLLLYCIYCQPVLISWFRKIFNILVHQQKGYGTKEIFLPALQ